jgi:hypothetical protein
MGKADDLGLFDDVNATPNVPALRGDVVKMIDNSLTVKHLVQEGYGDLKTYKEGDKTFLSKLKVTELKDVKVTEIAKVNSKLDDDEIKLDDDVYTLKANVTPEQIFGLTVDAWVNDDDEVFYVKVKTDDKDILLDMLDEYKDGVAQYAKDATKVNLIAADDSYDIADDAVIYVNHAKAKVSDLKQGQYGRFVLEKGEVIFADVVDAKAGMDGIIVKDVDEKAKIITYIYDSDETSDLDLTDADAYHIYLDGKTIDVDEIKEDDVLYVAEIDNEYFITVVRNKVEGTLDKAKDSSATIDGKAYDKGIVAHASQDLDKTVNAYSADNVKDLVGEEVVALLDINGHIRFIRGDVETTSDDIYGIAVKGQDYYDTIKIYVNGETRTYDVKRGTNDVPALPTLDTYNGRIVKFTLNKDGKINHIEDVTPDATSGYSFDKDNDAILVGSTVEAFVTSSTEFVRSDSYTSNKFDTDSLDVLEWDTIKSKTPSGTAYIVKNSKNEALYVVFVGADAFAETEAGVVLDKYRTTDGWVAKVDVFDAGEKEYVLYSSTGLYANLSKGDVITFNVNADNELVVTSGDIKFDASSSATYASVSDSVYSRDGRYVKFNSAPSTIYKITDKTVVYKIKFDENNKYDTIEKSSYTKIAAGMPVVYITGDANTLKVIAYAVTDATTPSTPTPAYDATLKQTYVEGDATILLDVNGTVKPYEMATTWYIDKAEGITLDTDASGNIIIPQGAKIKFTLVEGTQKVGYIEVVQLP